jgi:hypothetical protein
MLTLLTLRLFRRELLTAGEYFILPIPDSKCRERKN